MIDSQSKPSADKIAQRAIALQLIVDRGWSDHSIQKESWIRRRKTKKVQRVIEKWDDQEHVAEWLTPKEREIWGQPFGTLSQEDQSLAKWQLESLVPLVWALGIRSELPEFSLPAKDEHYNILKFGRPKPVESILSSKGLTAQADKLSRSPAEIELQAKAYLLLNWRVKELRLNRKKRVDLREAVPRVFGSWAEDALDLLPLSNKGELVIDRWQLIITELTKRELNEVEIIFEKRQKALNWLSGENPDWDAVETDTNDPNNKAIE